LTTADWKDMDEDFFRLLAKNSPLKRSKWKGIQRNLNFISE
jgi:epoxyqueuosine reductase